MLPHPWPVSSVKPASSARRMPSFAASLYTCPIRAGTFLPLTACCGWPRTRSQVQMLDLHPTSRVKRELDFSSNPAGFCLQLHNLPTEQAEDSCIVSRQVQQGLQGRPGGKSTSCSCRGSEFGSQHHTGQLTTACNSSSERANILFWPP